MKKLMALGAFIALSVFCLTAESPDYSAEFDFSIVDKNIWETMGYEDVPGLQIGSSIMRSQLDLSLSGYLTDKSKIDRLYLGGDITAEERDRMLEKAPRWSFYTSVNLADSFHPEEEETSTSDDYENYYSLIQRMIDWYEDNRFEFGLAKLNWSSISYAGTTDITYFISGSTVKEVQDINWTRDRWNDSKALFDKIKEVIETRINYISSEIDIEANSDLPDQFTLSGSELEKAKLEKRCYDEYRAYVYGEDNDAYWSIPLTNTRLELTRIGGILDAEFFYMDSKLHIGDELYTTRATHEHRGHGMEVSLTENLIPGFGAGLRFQISEGESSVAEDWDTLTADEWEGENGEIGLIAEMEGSFRSRAAWGDISYWVSLEGGVLDFYNPLNYGASMDLSINSEIPMTPVILKSFGGSGAISFNLDTETNMISYDDEYRDGEEATGYAFFGDLSVDVAGFGPKGTFKYKSSEYGGDSYGNTAQDRFTEESLEDDFNNTSLDSAMCFEAGGAFNTLKLLRKDMEIYFLYQKMLTGEERDGWRAGLTFNFDSKEIYGAGYPGSFSYWLVNRALSMPLSGDFEVSKYGEKPLIGHAALRLTPNDGISFYLRGDLNYDDYEDTVLSASAGTSIAF